MRTLDEVQAELQTLRATLQVRQDGTPNLRDYGLSDDARLRYETAIASYAAETNHLNRRMQALGYEGLMLRGRPTLVLSKDITAEYLAMDAPDGDGYPADHVIGPRRSNVTLIGVENDMLEVRGFANDPCAEGFIQVSDVY